MIFLFVIFLANVAESWAAEPMASCVHKLTRVEVKWRETESCSYKIKIDIKQTPKNHTCLKLTEQQFFQGNKRITAESTFFLTTSGDGFIFQKDLKEKKFLSTLMTSKCLKNEMMSFDIISSLQKAKLDINLNFFGPLPFFEMMHVVEFAKIISNKTESGYYFCQSLKKKQTSDDQREILWKVAENRRDRECRQSVIRELSLKILNQEAFIEKREFEGNPPTDLMKETLVLMGYRLKEQENLVLTLELDRKNQVKEQITDVLQTYGLSTEKASLISDFFAENWTPSPDYCFYKTSESTKEICEDIKNHVCKSLSEAQTEQDHFPASLVAREFLKRWSALDS